MSSPRQQVAEVLDALIVHSPAAYTWVGQRFRLPPLAGGETAAGALARELAARLYLDAYVTGGVTPGGVATPWMTGPWPSAAARELSAANRGTGSRQAGWTVHEVGAQIVVERDGLRLWADPAQVLPDGGGGAGVGEPVVLVVPEESFGPPHGFYAAYGDAGRGDGAIDRFYWNVRPGGRPALIEAVTSLLNEAGLPFRVKVLSRPDLSRCDAGVLYAPASDRSRVVAVVAEVHRRVAPHLREAAPALTKRLAPGLGFAEDPPGEESFGTHRCALLAGALVDCLAAGRTTGEARMEAVEEAFRRKGLALDAPHRNPGSVARDDPPAIA